MGYNWLATFDSGFLPIVIGLFQLSVALPLVKYKLTGTVRRNEEANVNPHNEAHVRRL